MSRGIPLKSHLKTRRGRRCYWTDHSKRTTNSKRTIMGACHHPQEWLKTISLDGVTDKKVLIISLVCSLLNAMCNSKCLKKSKPLENERAWTICKTTTDALLLLRLRLRDHGLRWLILSLSGKVLYFRLCVCVVSYKLTCINNICSVQRAFFHVFFVQKLLWAIILSIILVFFSQNSVRRSF